MKIPKSHHSESMKQHYIPYMYLLSFIIESFFEHRTLKKKQPIKTISLRPLSILRSSKICCWKWFLRKIKFSSKYIKYLLSSTWNRACNAYIFRILIFHNFFKISISWTVSTWQKYCNPSFSGSIVLLNYNSRYVFYKNLCRIALSFRVIDYTPKIRIILIVCHN